MKNLLYTFLLFIIPILNLFQGKQTFAQIIEPDTITWRGIINEAKNSESGFLWVKNAVIKADPKEQTKIRFFYKGSNVGGSGYNGIDFNRIQFDNCEFIGSVLLSNCNFEILAFKKCKFKYSFFLVNSSVNGWVSVNNCSIESVSFSNTNMSNLWLKNSEFHKLYIDKVTVSNRLLLAGNKHFPVELDSTKEQTGIAISNSNIGELAFESGEFPHREESRYYRGINIKTTDINYLKLNHVDVNGIHLDQVSVTKGFSVDSTVFRKFVSIDGLLFPKENTNFSWKYVSGNKLSLYDEVLKDKYNAMGDVQLSNEYQFNDLLSIYKSFFDIYQTRGDRVSSNACYVEMKDIETRRLNYLYRTEGSMKNYFNWRLNQFLKYFCEYGTSPVRSLIISMWVILGFAVLYLFTYSDWDKINRSFLVKKYRKMMQYFRSEQKLEDFYSEKHKEEFKDYGDFKTELEEGKIELPFLFRLLGKPLYNLSLAHHKLMQWLYRKTEILSGRWVDLRPAQKFYIGTVVTVAVGSYLVFLIFLRTLNSLFLSINTFSTLGFGDIPVKGIARYLAILEGFIGWFLLSIFSVSLISQILQN